MPLVLALLVLVAVPLPAAAPAPLSIDAPADLAQARQLVARGRMAEAEAILAAVVEAMPENAQAWSLLGYTRHAQGELELALEAHERAAEFPGTRANALYNAGCALARLGRTDEAFERLQGALAAGFANPELIADDADLASLRGDARFAALLPAANREPVRFTEPVRLIHTFDGEAAGDQFGWEGRNAGDVDGDGVDDLILSAPYKHVKGANAGRVYVHSGKSGELLFQRSGEPGDFLGIGIDGAGDVDGDGRADVIAGAWRAGDRSGYAVVLRGVDGKVLLTLEVGEAGDRYGWKVSGTGDLDGDGHGDLIVGAPGTRGTGRAFVHSGADGSLLGRLEGEGPYDGFGGSVAGTVEGGVRLVAVGAGNGGPDNHGRVSVFRWTDAGALEPAFAFDNDAHGLNLGRMFLAFVGDVDGDGVPDLYASDWEHGERGTGRVYVHSGADGKRLLTLSGERPREGFGIGAARTGDVDGDGHADLVIGAWQNDEGAPSGGKATLVSGRDGRPLFAWVCATPGDTFGFDAVGLGDVDGDGATDYLVTAAYSNVAGFRSGRAFVLAGPEL